MLALLPPLYLYPLVFVFGAVIGSFLNVVIYRFHTGRSLSGRSHCLSCGKPLRWHELVPVVSYVVLRARCSGCGSYIPPRYLLVEFLTATLFVGVVYAIADPLVVLLSLGLFSVLVVLLVYDYNHLIIPDELVIALGVIALLLEGYRLYLTADFLMVATDFIAALTATGFFWALWFFSHGRWLGFGDVKLVLPLSLLVGAPLTFSFVVWSFWIGAAISVLILLSIKLFRRGQSLLHFGGPALTMKSEVPFGPFLVAGFTLTYLFGLDVLMIMFYVLS